MKYRILCVGRRANDPLLDAADDYLARLNRYVPTELIRLKDSDPERESKVIIDKLGPAAGEHRTIALDERGEQLETARLAKRLGGLGPDGTRRATFIIGGAGGLTPAVRERADWVWALSGLTMPHRLALTVLAEQLYRAHTILRGEKYHRP